MGKIVLLVLLSVLSACSDSAFKEGDYEMIDLAGAFAYIGELSTEDLGKHISYIPLETTDESLIGKRAYVRILKDKLLVGSFDQPIKMFDKKTGKFLGNVGNIGQGANEYTLQNNMPVFWIDDAMEIIYVKTGSIVLRFDGNGNSLSSVSWPENLPHISVVSQITTENKVYVYRQSIFDKDEYKIYRYDMDSEEIQKYLLNEDEIISRDLIRVPLFFSKFENMPVSTRLRLWGLNDGRMIFDYTENPCLWVFDRNVYFKENFNDTIYQLSDNGLNPRLVFNLGDRHWPYEDRFKVEGNQNKIAIDYILEGKDCLFFVFRTNYYHTVEANTYWGVYNKSDKSVKVTDKRQIVDAANGLFIEALQTATSDGQLVGLIDAVAFLENNNGENTFDIAEEDNPIVVIVE